jgi:hypothetical protein
VASTRSFLLLLLLAACGGEPGVAAVDAGPGAPDAFVWHEGMQLGERACPEDSFLDYGNFAAGFLAEYCTGCHGSGLPDGMRQGAPPGVNFDGLAAVRAHAERIYLRAGDGYATMPPTGGPSPEARALLGEWLACGARE